MDGWGPRMVARDYHPPASRVANSNKDLQLILGLARGAGAATRGSRRHALMFAADEDMYGQKQAGAEDPPTEEILGPRPSAPHRSHRADERTRAFIPARASEDERPGRGLRGRRVGPVLQAAPRESCRTTAEAVTAAVAGYQGAALQSDDITVLALRYTGTS